MASSDEKPGPMPGRDDGTTPGKALTVGQQVIDRGAQLMTTSMKPINNMSQYFNTFGMYSHDMSRQIETHHFVSRLNQDFCQCAVYDSDLPSARLIGIVYIISEKIFEGLPPDEQKLWHSHTYKIKAGLWNNPRVPGIIENSELQTFAKMYGKFWCTWQVDRGDKLPLGAPALMMSPQPESTICAEMVKKRDEKYQISSDNLISSRANIAPPENLNSYADHWKQSGKGFAIDIQEMEMKTTAPLP
ncbi:oil body-associated protein 2A-like [Chenopodium quinoa]|uniref:oil body-associated protein 2A-like n=1 Tax=Chenopodium quinoa TaxID=63459 RepID=UPI000B7930A2|nr:oil body-associated protein 2A-like [Chenopodium quinoa]